MDKNITYRWCDLVGITIVLIIGWLYDHRLAYIWHNINISNIIPKSEEICNYPHYYFIFALLLFSIIVHIFFIFFKKYNGDEDNLKLINLVQTIIGIIYSILLVCEFVNPILIAIIVFACSSIGIAKLFE